MGLGEKAERATERVSAMLRRRSAHAASGLWTWIRHRPNGFLPRLVPNVTGPLSAELRAILALSLSPVPSR